MSGGKAARWAATRAAGAAQTRRTFRPTCAPRCARPKRPAARAARAPAFLAFSPIRRGSSRAGMPRSPAASMTRRKWASVPASATRAAARTQAGGTREAPAPRALGAPPSSPASGVPARPGAAGALGSAARTRAAPSSQAAAATRARRSPGPPVGAAAAAEPDAPAPPTRAMATWRAYPAASISPRRRRQARAPTAPLGRPSMAFRSVSGVAAGAMAARRAMTARAAETSSRTAGGTAPPSPSPSPSGPPPPPTPHPSRRAWPPVRRGAKRGRCRREVVCVGAPGAARATTGVATAAPRSVRWLTTKWKFLSSTPSARPRSDRSTPAARARPMASSASRARPDRGWGDRASSHRPTTPRQAGREGVRVMAGRAAGSPAAAAANGEAECEAVGAGARGGRPLPRPAPLAPCPRPDGDGEGPSGALPAGGGLTVAARSPAASGPAVRAAHSSARAAGDSRNAVAAAAGRWAARRSCRVARVQPGREGKGGSERRMQSERGWCCRMRGATASPVHQNPDTNAPARPSRATSSTARAARVCAISWRAVCACE